MTDMKDLFRIVKKHCGLKWKDLGRSLGFEETELEVVDAKHKDAGESCMEILSTWWYRSCREATPQTLLNALAEAGLKDIADQIDDYLSHRETNINHKESCSTRQPSKTPCSREVFLQVANSIGDNWKALARHLDSDVREAVLRAIANQYDQNAKECCRHVLEDWKQKDGRDATLETLRTALRAAGLAEIADDIYDGREVHIGDEAAGRKIKTEASDDTESARAELTSKGLRKSFQTVADAIGDGWKHLAIHFGKNGRQIRGIEHQHGGNTRECCLHVLDEWKLQRGNQVTEETLKAALRSAGLVDIISTLQGDGPSDRHERQHTHLQDDATIAGTDLQRPSQERDHRNVTILFKRIPRQSTFGDKRLEGVCNKVAIYMDNLKEQGDWNTYDRFVTKAFHLYKEKPDVMIRITLEDIAASYYRGDLARGDKKVHSAHDLLLKTQDPQHHLAHLMYLKSAILRRRKRYDEAEGAIILARQGLEFIQIGRDSGEIWYNVAALFAEVLNDKVVDRPDLWERDVVPSLQSAIDHYRRSLAENDDDSCRNKLRRAHIRFSMALLRCWSHVGREKHVQQSVIQAADLRRAENSLLEVENNLWDDISERMECSWLLAKSDLMRHRGSYRRAAQLATNVITIAKKSHFPAEEDFAKDRLELLKQATKTKDSQVLKGEDILRDLSDATGDDDAFRNLENLEKVPKSNNTDPGMDTCAGMPGTSPPHTTEGSLVSKLVTGIQTDRHPTVLVSHGLNLTTETASLSTESSAQTPGDKPVFTTVKPPLDTSTSKTGSADATNPGSGLGTPRHHRPLTLFGQLGAPLVSAPQTRDPSCPPLNGTEPPQLVTSDGFYKKVTEERIEILATDVALDETSPLFDPCKDFYLEAVSLTIKGHLRWKGRNVYISAVNLTVTGDSATVDVSYSAHGQPDWDTPAQSGTAQGQAGEDGQAGGVGQRAGNATLYVGFLFGGQLEVLARGGPGGVGQAGGDGHVGASGQPNQDRDACCHGRSTAGTTGGKGGDGGKPGQSGDGGPGGVITIRLLNKTWEDLDIHNLQALQLPTADASGGPAGAPAAAGNPGPGGPGGEGSGMHCYNAGHWLHKVKRCEGPYAPPGPQGPSGDTPPPAPSGYPGPSGQASVDVIDFEDISEHISPEMVQITFWQGNRYYKEGDVEAARNVYLWVYFTMVNSSRPELRGHAREAMIYLMQIQHGLDFWAHAQNNIPMNSYSSIYTYLSTDIVPYAIDVEKDYNLYFAEATTPEQKIVVAKSSMDHNKFIITVLEKQKLEKLDELTQIQSELRDLEQQQAVQLARVQGVTAECKDAIEADLVHKATAIHFRDILKIAGAAIKIFASFYTDGLTLESGIKDIIGVLGAGKKLKGLDFLDQLKGVKTIIKNVGGTWDKDKGIISSDLKDIEEQYGKIKDTLDHKGQENQQKIVVDGKKFDEQFDKWLYLAQCRDAKPRIKAYLNITQAVNDKLVHHDAVVIMIHGLDAGIQVLQQQNARLRSETAEVFDPTIISYAIAIGRVYVQLKDSIVYQMKRLQQAYNYQFLERRPFSYDDSRMAMIEAWLANNRRSMLQRMEKIGNDVQVFNADSYPLTNTIVLRRRDLADDFAQFDNGTGLSFVISGAEDLLMPMTHVHMADVKAWIPGVHTKDRRLKVWLKRYGTSLVYDQQGGMWTFTHAPRTMLFHYNTDSLQVYSKADIHQTSSDYVRLSPIGPWTLAVPREYNPGLDVTKVREIHLQLTLTFLPCAQPVCPPRTRLVNFTDAGAGSTSNFHVQNTVKEDGTGSTAWVPVLVVLAVLFCGLVVGVVYVRKRRSAQSPPGNSETTPLTGNTAV